MESSQNTRGYKLYSLYKLGDLVTVQHPILYCMHSYPSTVQVIYVIRSFRQIYEIQRE